MHKVKFLVKNNRETDPEYKLVTSREVQFGSFQSAMNFVRDLRSKTTQEELLLGQPLVEVG